MFQLLLMFHLISDFIVQNDKDVARRNEKPLTGNLLHIIKTYITYCVMLIIFWLIVNPGSFGLLFNLSIKLLLLAFMHFFIDLIKTYVSNFKFKIPLFKKANNEKFNIWALIIDQMIHVVSIILFLQFFVTYEISYDNHNVIFINAVLISTFFGHELIKLLLNCILIDYVHDNNFKSAKHIGILERLLITPSILLGFFEVLIVILGLKVFSDFKQEDSKIINRNAFIIGNLLSLSMVFLGIIYYYLFYILSA